MVFSFVDKANQTFLAMRNLFTLKFYLGFAVFFLSLVQTISLRATNFGFDDGGGGGTTDVNIYPANNNPKPKTICQKDTIFVSPNNKTPINLEVVIHKKDRSKKPCSFNLNMISQDGSSFH